MIRPQKHDVTTRAEDLKRGDVFTFRKVSYLSLSNFTDRRHTQTIVTAVPVGVKEYEQIVVLRLFRTFGVHVTAKTKIDLKILSNSDAELELCNPPDIYFGEGPYDDG